jgi:hypothetical protein
MSNFQALNNSQHQKLKIKTDGSYAHAENSHVVPLSVFELSQAQADYPIVLIKDAQTGQFHLVALVGLESNVNLFSHASGWQAEYIPMQLRGYPLALTASAENADNKIVAIDVAAASVNESEGEALFIDGGCQSEFLKNKVELMSQFSAQMPATQHFIKQLVKNELISPQSLTIKTNQGAEVNLTGLYIIDENKVSKLAPDLFNTLKEEHLLAAVYACMFSLQRISRLIKLT